MNKFYTLTKIIICILISTLAMGCEDDTTETPPSYTEALAISSKQVLFGQTFASQKSIELRAPSNWEISGESQSWCSISETQGTGNKELIVKVDQNTDDQSRAVTFKVKTIDKKDSLQFTVTQRGVGRASQHEMDSLVLVALYDATNGDNWKNNTNWKKGPISTWYGVNASLGQIEGWYDPTRVLQIILNSNNLAGKLPDELYELSALQDLVVFGNNLVGELPAEIGQLQELRYLNMHTNRFSGEMPAEIGQLENIRMIHLAHNQLTSIAKEIGDIPNLEELYLQNNQIAGAIPTEIFNPIFLQKVNLSNNKLTGTIPSEIGEWKDLGDEEEGHLYFSALTQLYLQNNQLTGSIPASFNNLGDGETNLIGYIAFDPPLPGLVALERLDLSGNKLSGAVPPMLISGVPGTIYYPQNGTQFSNYPSGVGSPYQYLLGKNTWGAVNLFNGKYDGGVTLELHPTNPNSIYIKGIPFFSTPLQINMSVSDGKHIAKIELPQSGGTNEWENITYAYCYLVDNIAQYLDDKTKGTLVAQTTPGTSKLSFTGGGISPLTYKADGSPFGSIVQISVYPNSLSLSSTNTKNTFDISAKKSLSSASNNAAQTAKALNRNIKNKFKKTTRGLGIQN